VKASIVAKSDFGKQSMSAVTASIALERRRAPSRRVEHEQRNQVLDVILAA
jgi:hypothetical protein